MRSKCAVLYQPSRSLITHESRSEIPQEKGTHVTNISQIFLLLDHFLQHFIRDITQLECSSLFRDRYAVKIVCSSAWKPGECEHIVKKVENVERNSYFLASFSDSPLTGLVSSWAPERFCRRVVTDGRAIG
jgi:hypothetical protein